MHRFTSSRVEIATGIYVSQYLAALHCSIAALRQVNSRSVLQKRLRCPGLARLQDLLQNARDDESHGVVGRPHTETSDLSQNDPCDTAIIEIM